MFVFGLVTGIAVTLLLNNFTGITLAANNGARQAIVDDSGTANTGNTGNTAPAPTGTLAAVQSDEHIRGDIKKAKVVLVEYADFQCPYCGKHDPTMVQLVKDYGDQVAWVYRHFPLTSIHPNAAPAALASECASEQGKFWEFADAMIAGQSQYLATDATTANDYFTKTAQDLNLNMTKFNSCVSSKKYQSVVDADQQSGETAGVNGTPATFVNGTLVSGAVPYATLKQMVDTAIAAAK